MLQAKQCNRCEQSKPVTEFRRGNICKACENNSRRERRKLTNSNQNPQLTDPVPEGYYVKSISTFINSKGTPVAQWIKTNKDQENILAQLEEAVKTIAEPFRGQSNASIHPGYTDDDLLCVYPMGDPHLGMYATAQRTGQEFNLEIAERTLVNAVDSLVGIAPRAAEALIINLGDFFHNDNSSNRTARSGAALDVDGYWSDILSVGIRTMRRCIDKALEKHERVTVINEIGNHDDHSAMMLSLCLQQYYENNPRVHIDTSPETFHWFVFGENLIGVTHGNSTKPEKLPGIMAYDRKEDWGKTTHRYWYTGHVHHDSVKEYPGCIVETFRTLAGKDAWHHSAGYRSGQDMKCDVLHKKYGRINRHIVGVQQLL